MTEETGPKDQQEKPQSSFKSFLVSWAPVLVIPLFVYLGNVELQSHLGRQALEETGLPSLELNDALDRAKQENKLVLADMSAIWCPSCRKLDKEVFSNDAVKKAISEDYVFSRIEYESEQGKAFMRKYDVQGFPTLLILDSNGGRLKKLPLTFSPEIFISLIKQP